MPGPSTDRINSSMHTLVSDGGGRGAERQRPAVLLPQRPPRGPAQAHTGRQRGERRVRKEDMVACRGMMWYFDLEGGKACNLSTALCLLFPPCRPLHINTHLLSHAGLAAVRNEAQARRHPQHRGPARYARIISFCPPPLSHILFYPLRPSTNSHVVLTIPIHTHSHTQPQTQAPST